MAKQKYENEFKVMIGATDENISRFIKKEIDCLLTPWNIYFLIYNPADKFEKLSIPVLSLNGSKDIHVDPIINQDAIQNTLIKGMIRNIKL